MMARPQNRPSPSSMDSTSNKPFFRFFMMNPKGFFSDFGKEASYSRLTSSKRLAATASLNIVVPLTSYYHI